MYCEYCMHNSEKVNKTSSQKDSILLLSKFWLQWNGIDIASQLDFTQMAEENSFLSIPPIACIADVYAKVTLIIVDDWP